MTPWARRGSTSAGPPTSAFTLTNTLLTRAGRDAELDTLSGIDFVGFSSDGGDETVDASAFSGAMEYRSGDGDDSIKGANGFRAGLGADDIIWGGTGRRHHRRLRRRGPASRPTDPPSMVRRAEQHNRRRRWLRHDRRRPGHRRDCSRRRVGSGQRGRRRRGQRHGHQHRDHGDRRLRPRHPADRRRGDSGGKRRLRCRLDQCVGLRPHQRRVQLLLRHDPARASRATTPCAARAARTSSTAATTPTG